MNSTRTNPTRRRLLESVAAAGAASLAGCGVLFGDPYIPDCEGEQRSVETPAMGDPDADVTVVEYTDFSCPHCRDYNEEEFPAIREEYVEPGEIRYEYHDFPIPVDDEWSWTVPNAALAVLEDAGDDAYFAFRDRAYDYQGEYDADTLASLGGEVGADEEFVRTAVDERPYCEQLVESREAGEDAGVDSTPTIAVDGEKTDEPTAEDIAEAIESAK